MENDRKFENNTAKPKIVENVTRRKFMKGAGLVGLGTVGMSSSILTAINAEAQTQSGTIPVGGAVPLTGWAAADGIEFKRALELAVEEINAVGGILGAKLEPVFEDTKEQGAANIIPAMQRLIDRYNVHAIINGYNTGAVSAEYDTIADAGVMYIHHNTDVTHYDKIKSDPDRYFSIFMGDPAEYYYGAGLLNFLNDLEKNGDYKFPNKKIFIVTGSQNYSVVIAKAIEANASKMGWEISAFETVVVPISEWGPTLAKIRKDKPAVIAITHWVPQDLALFAKQFAPNPTDSLVYMQYGPSLSAFRDIGQEAVNGVIYSTVIAALQDEIGNNFGNRYKAKFGPAASHLVGAQVYDSCNYWAVAAALAGGTGKPGDFEQSKKIANRLRNLIWRGTMGTTAWMEGTQGARPYPDETDDPSIGMPHQYLQHQDYRTTPKLIAPKPYDTANFVKPPWIKL